ncbi:MAG: hypothetical protein JWQ71_2864 [Pedosphaera sp.]|nr:hypothetical protein [Pedosphaera sp.]
MDYEVGGGRGFSLSAEGVRTGGDARGARTDCVGKVIYCGCRLPRALPWALLLRAFSALELKARKVTKFFERKLDNYHRSGPACGTALL